MMDGGGQPTDAASFFDATGPVTASLVTGTATGDGSDTFSGVSQLDGGPYDDTLTGNVADNFLGGGGNDTLFGGGEGNDTFTNVNGLNGGPYGDTLTGNAADNFLSGFGNNTRHLLTATIAGPVFRSNTREQMS